MNASMQLLDLPLFLLAIPPISMKQARNDSLVKKIKKCAKVNEFSAGLVLTKRGITNAAVDMRFVDIYVDEELSRHVDKDFRMST